MKATHKRADSPGRVFHADKTTGTIYVNVKSRGWNISAWRFDPAGFFNGASPLITFKGNK